MRLALRQPGLAALLALGACAVMPSEPGLLALPGTGKTLEQFQGDDVACRQYAVSRSSAAGQGSADLYEMQRRYDFAYIQCMYSKGNKVPVSGGYTGAPAGQLPPPGAAVPPQGAAPPPPAPTASPAVGPAPASPQPQ
jgi:hypothetical protein